MNMNDLTNRLSSGDAVGGAKVDDGELKTRFCHFFSSFFFLLLFSSILFYTVSCSTFPASQTNPFVEFHSQLKSNFFYGVIRSITLLDANETVTSNFKIKVSN